MLIYAWKHPADEVLRYTTLAIRPATYGWWAYAVRMPYAFRVKLKCRA